MPTDDAAPGFWMNEQSGVLAPVVKTYLLGGTLTPDQVATMCAYLRQWIMAPGFRGADDLRASVDRIQTVEDLERWLDEASDQGIDPL